MIIKRLNINNFGNIKNKILYFKPGFNIIYGENETGKSTIQGFIKVFLYGMNNKKGRSIKNNDRLKYTPFKDMRTSGELCLEYNNTDIIIKRKFGNSKKEDISSVINNITGESIEDILKDEPGKSLLGLNYESFNNTLFISQLGLPLNYSKDDEVINKIINIFQSGEESVSYNKVKLNLETMKKEITTARQGGELDLLNEKYHKLTNEKYKKLALNEENLSKELILIDLKNKSYSIKKEIENLEIGKKYLKKLNLEKDYQDIKSYLNKVEILKKEKQLIDNEFSQNKIEINEEFLINIKEKTIEYFKAMDFYNEQLVDIHDLDRVITSKKEELKNYSFFEELPKDIEEKALKLMIEKETLKGNYSLALLLKKDISLLKEKYSFCKNKLNKFNLDNSLRDKLHTDLNIYENKLKELQWLLKGNNIDSKIEEKEIKIKKKLKFISLLVIPFCLSPVMLAYSSFEGNISMAIMGVIGSMIVVLLLKHRKKQLLLLDYYKEDIEHFKSIKILKKDIAKIEEELINVSNNIGCNDYKELICMLKEYNKIIKEIENLQQKIAMKEENYNNIKGENLINKFRKNDEIIESLMSISSTDNIHEFIEKVKIYKSILSYLKNINAQRKTMYKQIIALKDEATNKEVILKNMLKDINLENIPLENIFEEINFLLKKLKDKKEVELNLKNAEASYKLLLKNRNIEDLKEELKDFIKNNQYSSYKKEDDIEFRLKEKNKELLDIEKEVKDVEHSINTSMLSTRELSMIEQELDIVKINKQECEKKLKAIELALKYLEEGFNEIQKNYGPILNKKVSKYFHEITNGKYNEVRVSSNYELLVRDNDTKELINIEYLSNGTCDQVYLSLRLALIELIYSDRKIPIILDESFSQFDEKRLKEILKILCKISKEKQIILFSCQKREYEFLKNNNEVNVIKL